MTLQDDPDRRTHRKTDGLDRSPLGWVLAIVVMIVVAIGATLIVGRDKGATSGAASSNPVSAPAR